MRLLKRLSVIVIVISIAAAMNGCVYSNNKGWDELHSQEQQEIKMTLYEVREELNEDFASESDEGTRLALEIMDKINLSIMKSNK